MPAQVLNLPTTTAVQGAEDVHVTTLAQTMADDFVRQGWAVRENFLELARWQALAAEAERLWEQGAFRKAGVGRVSAQRVDAGIRGDYTLWLDAQLTPAACEFVTRELETLRSALNAAAYLGLFEFEGHFAKYPAGARYARHLDQPGGSEARRVSMVLYLNEDWQSGEGGELCLYPPGPLQDTAATAVQVLPRGGTLAIFASAGTHHEVRVARRPRLSLSGWLRNRA